MSDNLKILLAQLNSTVGDLVGNSDKAMDAWEKGRKLGADVVVLPEMFITGYSPQDLILKQAFLDDVSEELRNIARYCEDGPELGIGGPWTEFDRDGNRKIFNAYFRLSDGKVHLAALKRKLPNHGVFDEKRIFRSSETDSVQSRTLLNEGMFNDFAVGICEDGWHNDSMDYISCGRDLILMVNGSPYERGKGKIRRKLMVDHARRNPETNNIVYLNLVGAQDDQTYDGDSFIVDGNGKEVFRMPSFVESMELVEFAVNRHGEHVFIGPMNDLCSMPSDLEMDYHAMVMSLRDFIGKIGLSQAVLGISGGVDSGLVATVATDALGSENVMGVMLPSKFTSDLSVTDAGQLAENLGIQHEQISIAEGVGAIKESMSHVVESKGIVDENLQSRLRALFLMAISNDTKRLLLTTGNKSEVGVGYATIYGDMAGGFNPLKDLYKTRVFEMCKWRNSNHREWMMGPEGEVIPNSIITKPPSAELSEDQKDSDSLPEYEILDGILEILVDQDGSIQDCVNEGYQRHDCLKVQNLLYGSEFKRFQSAPGTRLSDRAFGTDRRYSVVNKWREK